MADNITLVRDTHLYFKERKLPLCILGVDLEKAFDSVNHNFLMTVLEYLNFGQVFKRWAKLLDIGCNSVVNGRYTYPKSGVGQGCPLSAVLFILVMEPLACALRNRNINGILVPGSSGRQAKLSLYMDDPTLLLSDNRSVRETLSLCEMFTLASGTKVNQEKSEALRLL